MMLVLDLLQLLGSTEALSCLVGGLLSSSHSCSLRHTDLNLRCVLHLLSCFEPFNEGSQIIRRDVSYTSPYTTSCGTQSNLVQRSNGFEWALRLRKDNINRAFVRWPGSSLLANPFHFQEWCFIPFLCFLNDLYLISKVVALPSLS